MANEKIFWGIHGGATGEADKLFSKEKCVAIGWPEMEDLSKINTSRETYKTRLSQVYSDYKPGAIPVVAGQIFRFVDEMKVGDFVVYPSKMDRQIHIGEVAGEYYFSKSLEPEYPHRRNVKWLKKVPRTRLSQGALYEIGSAMTFFQIKNYSNEYEAILEGKEPSIPQEDDATVAFVAEEIENTTRDYIIKQIARELKGHPFEYFVAHLLSKMGYKTRVTQKSGDGGIDIYAHKDELGFEPPIIRVQAKSGEGSYGDKEISELYGRINTTEFALFVILGSFNPRARSFAMARGNLRLIDGEELVDLIFEHYEELDSRYQGLFNLKRVFIPEPLKD